MMHHGWKKSTKQKNCFLMRHPILTSYIIMLLIYKNHVHEKTIQVEKISAETTEINIC